jgi:hypothetical protein
VYGEQDLLRAETEGRRAQNIALALGGAAFIAVVCGMIFRVKPLSLAAAIVGGCLAYGWISLKWMPWRDYLRFLREMATGLRRETTGAFVSVGEETRMVDGVRVRDFTLSDGGDVPILFYWDEEKPRPGFAPGQRLKLTAFGKFITSCEEIGQT